MKQRNILTIPIILSLLCLFVVGSAMAGDQPCNSGSDGGGSTATGNHKDKSTWDLQYSATNPTAINPGESANISVENGRQNFDWSIQGSGLSFEESGGTQVNDIDKRTLTVWADEVVSCDTSATIYVTDNNGQTVQGDPISISTSLSLEWDDVNSAQTVAATGSCTITVTEQAGGPYYWEITEGSAYFDTAHTQSTIETTSNTSTIYTYSACGVIAVSVKDACGLEVEKDWYIRVDGGTWDYLVTDYQGSMSDYTEAYFTPQKYAESWNCQAAYRTKTVGKYRIVYDWTNNFTANKVYSIYTRSGEFITTVTGYGTNCVGQYPDCHDVCRIKVYEWKCN